MKAGDDWILVVPLMGAIIIGVVAIIANACNPSQAKTAEGIGLSEAACAVENEGLGVAGVIAKCGPSAGDVIAIVEARRKLDAGKD